MFGVFIVNSGKLELNTISIQLNDKTPSICGPIHIIYGIRLMEFKASVPFNCFIRSQCMTVCLLHEGSGDDDR